MRKRSRLFFLAIFAVVSLFCAVHPDSGLFDMLKCSDAGAAEKNETEEIILGTVDIAALYAFHPLMQYYDQRVDLFIKLPPKNITYQDFFTLTQNRQSEFQKIAADNSSEIKRIKDELALLRQDIQKLDSGKAIEAAPVNEKFDKRIQSAASEDERKKLLMQRTAELEKIEVKFETDLLNKNKKMSELLDSYEKIQRSLLKIYYLTPEETAAKFEDIDNEIKEAVKIAAKKKGVKAVMNFSLPLPEEQNDGVDEKSLKEKNKINSDLENLLAAGPDYSKAFSILKTSDDKSVENSGDESLKKPDHVKFLSELAAGNDREDAMKIYTSKRYFTKLKAAARMASRSFIYGGTDLTRLALIIIMAKGGISKEKAEAASEVMLNVYSEKATAGGR